MKQTAVEWYAVQAMQLEIQRGKGIITISQMLNELSNILDQAKSMEKEQIVEAVESTIKSVKLTEDKTAFFAMGGEGYYNETYESKTNI